MKFCSHLLLFALCVFAAIPAFASDKQEALKRLGLQSSEGNPEKIKAAHRAAVKRFHPDAKGPEASAEKFNAIQEAYDFLTGKIPKLSASQSGPRSASSPKQSSAAQPPKREFSTEVTPSTRPTPSAEYKIFAQQCANLYKKTANLRKGN